MNYFHAPEMEDGDILFSSCLSFCNSVWNSNLANNFWTVSAIALIFHMSTGIPCDNTFMWVPIIFILNATSCKGYNVFDPSVSPSVLFFLLAQLLWNRSTEFRETL